MTLEELLGAEQYTQAQEKMAALNEAEPDKKKHVRFVDLSEGGYVSAAKYEAMESERNTLKEQVDSLTDSMAELKKNSKGNDTLQATIDRLTQQLTALCGADGFTLELNGNQFLLAVQVDLLAKQNFQSVAELLERVVPANLRIDLRLRTNIPATMRVSGALQFGKIMKCFQFKSCQNQLQSQSGRTSHDARKRKRWRFWRNRSGTNKRNIKPRRHNHGGTDDRTDGAPERYTNVQPT